ncbi:carbohydrate esterase family 5 protein [Lophiostoma macrostomum CBS 122681]|uniref:Carbohydrate esterase family 5 protein n=1 Tax=Lophiostoma macrostomum CBS 122681 TaxID=1314788 RepID=A0A6A6TIA2_9PLEO|nr:carbohydrate esterase family 5 protein [Lophiostoma macrostomum CBS 122681]
MFRAAVFLTLLYKVATTAAQCIDGDPCPEVIALESSECTDYHAFLARGSDSPYPGHLGPLVKLTCDGLVGNSSSSDVTCGYENIIFPANSSFAGVDAWCESAGTGAKNGQQQMKDYADKCPDAHLILLGYSQGASVSLDILGGGGHQIFQCTQDSNPAFDPSTTPGSNIVAAAVFGAAIRNSKQGYSVKGGKDYNGTATRSDEMLTALDQFGDAGVLRDYCNFGDYVCAKGSEPSALDNHLNYFKKYNTEAAKWLIKTSFTSTGNKDALANFDASVSASASSSSAHPTPTATKKAAAKASETASAVAAASPSSGASSSRHAVFSGVLGLSVFAYLL